VHYETFTKKHDIKRKVHRHENWQKTRGVGENKKKPTTSLISSDKKDKKMLNSVQVGFKKHSSLSTSKSDNMRSILKIKKPTSHFEDHLRSDVAGAMPISHFDNHLRSDVSGAVSLITEPELKTTKRDFKRSSESEGNIHNDGDNILNFSSYLEEIRIQSPHSHQIQALFQSRP